MAVILIVDDHADSRWVLAHVVGRDRHTVLEADNGTDAIALCRTRQPDLVLLDLFMPAQDGFETLKVVRSELPKSRIIVVSAGWNVGDKDGLRIARELGADVTLRKPVDLDAVRSAVSELLVA
jgi:CheY-like chemotaxis protein